MRSFTIMGPWKHPKTHQTTPNHFKTTPEHTQTLSKQFYNITNQNILAIHHLNIIINNPKPRQRNCLNALKITTFQNTPNLLINTPNLTRSHPNHLKHPYKHTQEDPRYVQHTKVACMYTHIWVLYGLFLGKPTC